MMHNKSVKSFTILIFAIMGMFSFSFTAYADMGPKPELTIHVKNPPKELYYLDLLTQDKPTSSTHRNIDEEDFDKLDKTMLSSLSSFDKDGWYPALTEGTHILFGELTGKASGDEMIHNFSYIGVPDTYKIIIVTKSGKVTVSDICTRKSLQSNIAFDYQTGRATAPPIWIAYLMQFLSTCIPTLLIEGIILLLFGFKLKENYKIFLLVNLATQIVLTLILGVALIKYGPIIAYLIQFPVEIAILITETLIFAKFLKGKSKTRKVVYGITANVVSWALGFFLIIYQFDLLSHLL